MTANSDTYAYDAGNQRIYHLTDGKKLATYSIATYTDTTINLTQQSKNVYFAGRLITAENSSVAVDRLGSVRWNTASSTYHAYFHGVDYPTTTNDTEKYATYTRDSVTGLDYAMNRYYSSQWGRFMSPDPYGGSVDVWEPQRWNRYSYVGNDPVTSSDPNGLCIINGEWYPQGQPPCPDGSGITVFGDQSWVAPGLLFGPAHQPSLPLDPAGLDGDGNPLRPLGILRALFLAPAVAGAETLLVNNPTCDQLFNSGTPFQDPATVLQDAYNNNQIRLVPFDGGIPSGVGAQTTGVNGVIYIASNRYFVTGILI